MKSSVSNQTLNQVKPLSKLFIVLALVVAIACTREKPPKPSSKRLVISNSEAVFYNPPQAVDDSLKKSLGDGYYCLRDSLTSPNRQLTRLYDSLGIAYRFTDADVIEFKESDGRTTIFETSRLKAPWGVIHFEKGMPPVSLTTDYKESLRILRTVVPGFILAPEPKPVPRPETAGRREQAVPVPTTEPVQITPREYLTINQLTAIQGEVRSDLATGYYSTPSATELSAPSEYNRINLQSLLLIKFDNDIFTNTDYYYTNGVRIEHFAPVWKGSPVARLLISPSRKGETYYGISIVQNMYTPLFPVREEIQYGDRPFASYLYMGHLSIYNYQPAKFRLTTELDLGVIGPASLGASIQSYLHGEEKRPKGWKNQIANDLIANYNIEIEKGIVQSNQHELIATGGLLAGTLYTNGFLGVRYQWGNRRPYFSGFNNTPLRFSPRQPWFTYFTYEFSLQNEIDAVGYDATLQGGVFNHDSPYTLSSGELNRFLWRGQAGITLSFKKYTASFIQNISSPEFAGMRWHKWGRIKLIIPL